MSVPMESDAAHTTATRSPSSASDRYALLRSARASTPESVRPTAMSRFPQLALAISANESNGTIFPAEVAAVTIAPLLQAGTHVGRRRRAPVQSWATDSTD